MTFTFNGSQIWLIQFNSIQFNSLFQTRVHTHVYNNIIQNKYNVYLPLNTDKKN